MQFCDDFVGSLNRREASWISEHVFWKWQQKFWNAHIGRVCLLTWAAVGGDYRKKDAGHHLDPGCQPGDQMHLCNFWWKAVQAVQSVEHSVASWCGEAKANGRGGTAWHGTLFRWQMKKKSHVVLCLGRSRICLPRLLVVRSNQRHGFDVSTWAWWFVETCLLHLHLIYVYNTPVVVFLWMWTISTY